MKLNNILSCLQNTDDRVIFKKNNKEISIQDLIPYAGSEYLNQIIGKKVAIDSLDFDKAIMIVLLDGIVDELFILPKGFLEKNKNFLKINKIDEVIDLKKFKKTKSVSSSLKQILPKYKYTTKWILLTSGTSGTPKQVQHSFLSISSSVKKSKKNFNPLTWGSAYSLDRFAGTQVFLQAILGGGTIIFPKSNNIKEMIDEFISNDVNSISATPTLWRKILMQKNCKNMNLKNITLGGEIADQNILNSLLKFFPSSSIRHIYASTEAGASITVEDNLEGFPESLMEDKNNKFSIKISDKGTLMIKASGMSQGYKNSNEELASKDEYYDTGDLVELRENRYYFLGRESGIINIGGSKIIPEEVENNIMKFPGVLDAVVYGRKNSIIGNMLVCELIIDKFTITETKTFIDSLKKFYKKKYSDVSCPRMFKIIEEVKTSEAGKVIRR